MLNSGFYNMDCMEGMKEFPDKFFDLAIVDPPYGAGFTEGGGCKGWFTKYHQEQEPQYNRFGNPGSRFEKYKRESNKPVCRTGGAGGGWRNDVYGKKIIAWDTAPGDDYFKELFRVSRNQIIWGGNYFKLPPTRCFVIWRKLSISENFTMAMAEYAWTSFNENAKVFECAPQGNAKDPRFHPTQKPVALYEWLLSHYAEKGDKILDTHVGSGSSLMACHNMGYEYWGFEIDKEYYEKATARIEENAAQIRMELNI